MEPSCPRRPKSCPIRGKRDWHLFQIGENFTERILSVQTGTREENGNFSPKKDDTKPQKPVDVSVVTTEQEEPEHYNRGPATVGILYSPAARNKVITAAVLFVSVLVAVIVKVAVEVVIEVVIEVVVKVVVEVVDAFIFA